MAKIEASLENAGYPGARIPASADHLDEINDIANKAGLHVTHDIYDLPRNDISDLYVSRALGARSAVLWHLKTLYLNPNSLSIGALTDEFLHIWNKGRKGEFLSDKLAAIHQDLFRVIKKTPSEDYVYHGLEMMNFMLSGHRWPRFMEDLPEDEIAAWFIEFFKQLEKGI